MDERKLLLRFLLKKLRETRTDLYAYRMAIANFTPESVAEVHRFQEVYRMSDELQARVEREFHTFDELIERSPEESQMLLAVLEKWNPEGDPN